MRACPACQTTVEVGEDSILCMACGKKYHTRCVLLANDDAASWNCTACSDPSLPVTTEMNKSCFNVLLSKLTELQKGISDNNKLVQEQSRQIMVCQESIAENNRLIEAQTLQIKECKSDIASLRTENAELKDRVSQLESALSDIAVERVYNEAHERVRRECNLIVNGLRENEATAADLLRKVSEIFESIMPQNNVPIVSVIRMGRMDSSADHPRPVLVRLANSNDPITMLRNKSNIDKQKFPSIRIKADLTKSQREYLNRLFEELAARRNNGERNLGLRYVNRQPTIVTFEKKKHDGMKRSREESTSPRRSGGTKVPNRELASGSGASTV